MRPKKSNLAFYIGFGCFVFILFIMIAMHLGVQRYAYPDESIAVLFPKAIDALTSSPFAIYFTPYTFSYIGAAAVIFAIAGMILYVNQIRNKHDLSGAESGSAKWNNDFKKYNKEFSDPKGSPDNNGKNNIILTQNVCLSMNSRDTRRNLNVVVVGGSGSGKSRFYVKPNILQANCNYVITDPAGELLSTTGDFLQKQGYEIKVFNLVEMAKSNCYNPFHYIRDDQGVLMMINCLIKNTNPAGQKGGDPFWEKSETALLQALCFYLIKYCPEKEQNFSSVMKMLRAAEVDENDANKKSKLDLLFDEVAQKDPNSIALKQYQTFKMGAGKTLKSILISCSVRLTVFNLKQIASLTSTDNIHLEELGGNGENKKQALFVIIPAADNTFNFLVSMMYSQLFETLYYVAETKCEKQSLPRHVRFLLDEFANIGQIPEFTQKLSTMRKYEISCNVILQNLAQIKTMYKDDWETIIGNSDSFLFLGGQEYSTLEYISKELGNQTITVRDRSSSQGKSGSSSKSFKQTSRSLMFPDELGKLPNGDCVLLLRALDPFYDKKYDYPKHPNYKYTGDADKKFNFINTINNISPVTAEELKQANDEKTSKMYRDSIKNGETSIIGSEAVSMNIIKKIVNTETSDFFKKFVFLSNESSDELSDELSDFPTLDTSGQSDSEPQDMQDYELMVEKMTEQQKNQEYSGPDNNSDAMHNPDNGEDAFSPDVDFSDEDFELVSTPNTSCDDDNAADWFSE